MAENSNGRVEQTRESTQFPETSALLEHSINIPLFLQCHVVTPQLSTPLHNSWLQLQFCRQVEQTGKNNVE